MLTSNTVLTHPLLVAKTIFSISLMLDASMNHLKIEQYSKDAYTMWNQLKWCFTTHNEVTINFTFLLSKLKKIG